MARSERISPRRLRALLAAILLPSSGLAVAAPIPVDLSVTGQIEVLGSSFVDTGALFSDALAQRVGGADTLATYSHDSLSASLGPTALTHFGDGVGFGAGSGTQAYNEASVGGGFAPGQGLETNVDLDLRIAITNTSAVDTWKVTFLAEYESRASAAEAPGPNPPDSRVQNRFTIDGPAGSILVNDAVSDNLAGNSFNGVATGDSGGDMYQDGTEYNFVPVSFLFDLVLNPGDSALLDGAFTTQLRAYLNDDGIGAVALSAFAGLVSIHDAAIVPPSPADEPPMLLLVISGLVVLAARGRGRRRC